MKTLPLPMHEAAFDGNAGSPEFTVRLMNNPEADSRWPEVETALRGAFVGAEYNDDGKKYHGEGIPSDDPVAHTRSGIDGKMGPNLQHIIAEDDRGRLIGGIFCVPTVAKEGETNSTIGWVFTSPEVPLRTRPRLLDGLVEKVYETVTEGGFERVVVGMGTVAGSQVFSNRYGFSKDANHPHLWVGDGYSYANSRAKRKA